MSSLPSDEVAGDYKDALEDLITNDRFQIANLTMIAKENIEHAQAIARTLTAHIKRTPPSRKLPALYVLDSLVKNIGSPYTVYFGSGLHETFMLAYSQVDLNVRRKLEEMLRTWRAPVPGSLSSTPVFPLTATQSIMEALNRYKASTPMPPQQQFRPASIAQVQPLEYRNTPTPPHAVPYQPPAVNVQQPTPTPPPQQQQYYQQIPPSQAPLPQYNQQPLPQSGTPVSGYPQIPYPQPAYPQYNGQMASNVDVRKLHGDIDDLTTDAKIDCMTHPMDQSKTKKLETLQSLKAFLDSGNLGPQDLQDVRDTITKEMEKRNQEKLAAQRLSQPPPQPQYPQQVPQWQPQLYSQQYTQQYQQQPQYNAVQPPQSQYQQPGAQPPPFLGSTNLAELLRKTQNGGLTPQAQNPPAQPYGPPVVSTPTLSSAVPAPANGTMSLLDQIRASGLLSNISTPQGHTPTMPHAQPNLDLVPFTSAAIKIPRPHLVLKFMNEKPNQCSTCGRRFTSDDAGKAQKAKHLDWHFKTKTRAIEAEQRGQNRSWYVDEHEWIVSKEYVDDLGLEDTAVATNGTSGPAVKKEQDFVRTPSDPAYRNALCPIDQEPFKSEWSADIQDFIWRDAIKVGDRYYHASCYKEATKAKETLQPVRAGTPSASMHRRTATPDSVLGKRKAEDDEPSSTSKSRLKMEA